MILVNRHLIICLVLGIAAGIVFSGLVNSCKPLPELAQVYRQPKPDTVRLKERIHDTVRLIKRDYRYLPAKVRVYEKPDTIRRAALEKDTLITGITLSGTGLEVQTISPKGISLVADYKLPEASLITLTLDHKGNLEVQPDLAAIRKKKRRERWRKIGNWALIGGAFVLGAVAK